MAHGWHFFMNPGPTNIPDRILRAMDRGTIDFTAAQFRAISEECFAGLKRVFKTEQTVLAYAATGHGAWEAALVNLFSPGDKVLLVESGFFSLNWGLRGQAFGLEGESVPNAWRRAADPAQLEPRLRADTEHQIKAVLVVHNETSTGVTHPVAELRRAIDAARHPALYLVDTISSLASFDFRMDEWGVDVVVAGSQKGLMLPTGMAFTGVSAKALAATAAAKLPRVYWDWRRLMGQAAPGLRRQVQRVARRRARPAPRPRLPHRPSGRPQRADGLGLDRGGRDGARTDRRAAWPRCGPGRDGVPGRDRLSTGTHCDDGSPPLYTGRGFRDLRDERRHSPGLSRDHGHDDRRVDLSDAFDLWQGGRHAAPRNRPEVPSGLDRWAAPAARYRRPTRPLQPALPEFRTEKRRLEATERG